ncbi:MAG: ATP-binding cassette domain-containing protein, partial [Alphaproteobacteria bacterium]|nr:ATP-binding cassette domain-containing protein [Alphaproteobacteria bacterium]
MAAQYAYVMKDMTKTFPGAPKPVLANINLQFYRGAKIGIVGPNGAGKSTLIKIMAGIDTDISGEAWPGENVTVGYLEQEPELDPTKTVLENVREGAKETADLVARFNEIVHELDGLSQAEGLDAFIAAWLPDPEAVSLLHEAVTACREEAEDVGQLFDGLYDAITAPEVPLEVAEVRVMSLHKSKGLSSRYVFIVGCVEGLIPSRPEAGTPQDIVRAKLEEDRRLFYVGLTRVKASPEAGRPGYLAITYPMRMPAAEAFRSQIAAVSTQGNVAVLRASRFLA